MKKLDLALYCVGEGSSEYSARQKIEEKQQNEIMENFKWLDRKIVGCYRGIQVIVHDTKGGIPKTGGAYQVEIQGRVRREISFDSGEEGFDPDEIESYCEQAINMFLEELRQY